MNKPIRSVAGAVAALLLAPAWPGGLARAAAEPLPDDELQRACWLRHTHDRTQVNVREPTSVTFSNLGRHWRTRSPFQVDFAVRGMGVVPAGSVLEGSGHHHILIDTPLPVDVRAKIPFSDTHRHFGKGQTGTVLDLPPGAHTLRLLFADHEHRPHYVFSPEMDVTVTGPRSASPLPIERDNFEPSCLAWYQDELTRPRPASATPRVLNLRDDEPVSSPFTLRLGVDGQGVGAAAASAEGSGYFSYEVRQDGRLLRRVVLDNGATQSPLNLPNGVYQLTLRFVAAVGGAELLPPLQQRLRVTGQLRL